MINMEMTPEERADYEGSIAVEAPKYPYGLRLYLDDEVVKKLGISELPSIDQTMMVVARVKVVGVSSDKQYGDIQKDCIQLQITDMELKGDSEAKSREDKLYGG